MKNLLFIMTFAIPTIFYKVNGQQIEFNQDVKTFNKTQQIESGQINLISSTLNFVDTVDEASLVTIALDSLELRMITSFNREILIDEFANITLSGQNEKQATINNGDTYDAMMQFQEFTDFDPDAGAFMIATREKSNESSGVTGNGSSVTIWSPGDTHGGVQSYMIVLDEDTWGDGDNNPYNNSAIKAFLNVAGTWQVSDRKQKSNIKRFQSGLEKTMQLSAYSYDYNQNEKEKKKGQKAIESIGVMAQEVEKIIPQAVTKTDGGDYFVNYSAITPVLIEAIKEQQEIIEELISRLEKIESSK